MAYFDSKNANENIYRNWANSDNGKLQITYLFQNTQYKQCDNR